MDKELRKFMIRVTETLEKTVECVAKTKEEAMDKVIKQYKDEEIVLSAEDYLYTEFE